MAYSSVVTHGEPLLRSLLEAGTFRVVYRPHPRTGANDSRYAAADRRLSALIRQDVPRGDAARHRVNRDPVWDIGSDDADVLISDISAVAGDWMATGKPIIVTVPAAPAVTLADDTILGAVTGLPAGDAARAAEFVERELARGGSAQRQEWVRQTLGDTTGAVSTDRFLGVCEELIALRTAELASRAVRLTTGRA